MDIETKRIADGGEDGRQGRGGNRWTRGSVCEDFDEPLGLLFLDCSEPRRPDDGRDRRLVRMEYDSSSLPRTDSATSDTRDLEAH